MQKRSDLRKHPVVKEMKKEYVKNLKDEFKVVIYWTIGLFAFFIIAFILMHIWALITGKLSFWGIIEYFCDIDWLPILSVIIGICFLPGLMCCIFGYLRLAPDKVAVGRIDSFKWDDCTDEDGSYTGYQSLVVVSDGKKYRGNNRYGSLCNVVCGETYVFILRGRFIRACRHVKNVE